MNILISRRWIGLLLALSGLGFIYFTTQEGFLIEIFFLLEILILTFYTRMISVKHALIFLVLGILISAGGTLFIGNVIRFLGADMKASLWSSWIFPILEEALKVLPVIILMFIVGKKGYQKLNPSDLVILATASGAGFSLVEKYFWETINFSLTYGPKIGEWYLFPDALGIRVSGETFGFIGHSAASALIAIGFGLSFYLKEMKKNLYWLPVVLLSSWVTLEHILGNLYYSSGSKALLSIGGGTWTPWIFIISFIALMIFEVKSRRNFVKNHSEMTKPFKRLSQVFKSGFGKGITNLLALSAYHRLINAARWNKQ